MPFVSLDGLDGTGKSLQVRLLADALRGLGHTVTTCADPGGTPLGAKLRELLLHSRGTGIGTRAEALLFMASRAELVEEVIAPALARGEVVISDRYLLANVVYQGFAGGLDADDLRTVGRFATASVLPGLTLVLDLDPEVAAARRRRPADNVEARGREYADRVRRGFLTAAKADPTVFVIDASPPPEVVHIRVLHQVKAFLGGGS